MTVTTPKRQDFKFYLLALYADVLYSISSSFGGVLLAYYECNEDKIFDLIYLRVQNIAQTIVLRNRLIELKIFF